MLRTWDPLYPVPKMAVVSLWLFLYITFGRNFLLVWYSVIYKYLAFYGYDRNYKL